MIKGGAQFDCNPMTIEEAKVCGRKAVLLVLKEDNGKKDYKR